MLNIFLLACVAALVTRLGFIIDGSYKKMQKIDFRITVESPGEIKGKERYEEDRVLSR